MYETHDADVRRRPCGLPVLICHTRRRASSYACSANGPAKRRGISPRQITKNNNITARRTANVARFICSFHARRFGSRHGVRARGGQRTDGLRDDIEKTHVMVGASAVIDGTHVAAAENGRPGGHVFVHRNGGTGRAKPNRRAPTGCRVTRLGHGARRPHGPRGGGGSGCAHRPPHRGRRRRRPKRNRCACVRRAMRRTHARTFSPACALLSGRVFFSFPPPAFSEFLRNERPSTMRRPHGNAGTPYGLRRYVDTSLLRPTSRAKRRRRWPHGRLRKRAKSDRLWRRRRRRRRRMLLTTTITTANTVTTTN